MQPSTAFNWRRVVATARWVAGIVGGGAWFVWVGASFGHAFGASPDLMDYVIFGVLGVGLLFAILWKGAGEVIGGLALIAGGALQGFRYLPPQTGELAAGAIFAVPGLLFIACGWYMLAQRRHHAALHPTV